MITTSGIIPSLMNLLTCITTTTAITTTTTTTASSNRIPQLDEEEHLFTPLHTEFLQCCISAGQYHIAIEFVKKHPIMALSPCISLLYDYPPPPSTSSTSDSISLQYYTSELFLRYQYYLGIIYIASNDYSNARNALHMCCTLPTGGGGGGDKISDITICARKKMILIHCLLLEKNPTFLSGGYVMMDTTTNTSTTTRPKIHDDGSMKNNHKKFPSTPLSKNLLSIPEGTSLPVCKLLERISKQYESSSKNNQVSTTIGGRGGGLEIHQHQQQEDPEQEIIMDELEEHVMNPEESSSSSSNQHLSSASFTYTSMNREITCTVTGESEEGKSSSSSDIFGLSPYEDIVHTFASGSISWLKIKIDLYKAQFVKDRNMGLIQRLIPALRYLLLIRASHVYQIMSFKRLVRFLDLDVPGIDPIDSIETWFMSLMRDDDIIPFRLDMEKEIISFDGISTMTRHHVEDSTKMITHRIESCIALAERISKLDIAITSSVKYQHALLKEEAVLKQTMEEVGRSIKDVPI